jgi:hypothetical protein
MEDAIDDYLHSYKSYDFQEQLGSIMVSTQLENGKVIYTINDAPEDILSYYLNKYSNVKNTLYIGRYKNIICIVQSENLQNFKHLFSDLNETDTNRPKQETLSNQQNLATLNWNPHLISIFNITDNTKKIIVNGIMH